MILMKKVLAICLAVLLVVSAGVLAFAQGGFVASPSGNDAPTIVEIIYEDGSCMPKVIITPYADREDLEDDKEEEMNSAYKEISMNAELSKLCPALKDVSATIGINYARFAVSDLFDISVRHNLPHDFCGKITLKLSAETLKNFVALMHRNSQGVWEIVPDVVIDHANQTLTFSASDFSPFAVVVDKDASSLPNTGSMLYIPAIAMVVSAVSLVAVLISIKKKQEA